jgi:ACS family tartrate transporter-like MFS transporter
MLLVSGEVNVVETSLAELSIARSAMSKASWRILPMLGLGYLIATIERFNVSFAATQMNADLGFSATVYGFGSGLFFLSASFLKKRTKKLLTLEVRQLGQT